MKKVNNCFCLLHYSTSFFINKKRFEVFRYDKKKNILIICRKRSKLNKRTQFLKAKIEFVDFTLIKK